MQVFRATLEARDPERGCFRAYQIEAGTDLFGVWVVDITYGRIGTRGRRIRYCTNDETEARGVVRSKLNRRSTAKKRIGVAYRICELIDPAQWVFCDSAAITTRPIEPRRVAA